MTAQLQLTDIQKLMPDGTIALKDIDLELKKGAKLSILGPSGSGKTTLLRIIAGLEQPDSGQIIFNHQNITGIPAYKRNFGLMFQEYALFPHLNVFDNIAFGLKMKKMPKNRIIKRVADLVDLTGLSGFENRKIDALSGGERQRVALARTLAPEPALLMLDEPLSSLDRTLRKHLLTNLTRILSELDITTIFVTHDHEEAFAAGNDLIIMKEGRIEQAGPVGTVTASPKNKWVADFLN